MYRAHLNYQIMGPWHEWVMVKFILEDKNISDLKKTKYTTTTSIFWQWWVSTQGIMFLQSRKTTWNKCHCSVLWSKEPWTWFHSFSAVEKRVYFKCVDSFWTFVMCCASWFIWSTCSCGRRWSMCKNELQLGCRLVLPRGNFWPNQFLSLT